MTILTVEYNLTTLETEQRIRQAIIDMGWIPPEKIEALKAQWRAEAFEEAAEKEGDQVRFLLLHYAEKYRESVSRET